MSPVSEQTAFLCGGTTTFASDCLFKTALRNRFAIVGAIIHESIESGGHLIEKIRNRCGGLLLAWLIHMPKRYDFYRLQEAVYARCAEQEPGVFPGAIRLCHRS